MTKAGITEYLRRGFTLLFLTLGLIGFEYWSPTIAWALIIAALAAYILLPRISPPAKALTYERIPAVIGPDLVGFSLTSVFIALPFWAWAGEEYMWDDFGVLVHPAAILVWPLALGCLFILAIAAKYACIWVSIEPDGLRVASPWVERFLAYDQIRDVTPYRRGLPKWLKWITPLLVLSGKFSAAGAILVARDTTGMTLQGKDGPVINIPEEAFEKPFRQILNTLHTHDVQMDPSFKGYLKKR